MSTLDDLLLPVFARQHWLVHLDDLRRAGASQQAASLRVVHGRWEQADLATYRLVGPPSSWESRLLAPILSAGNGARASHFAAGALHGIPGFGRGAPELSVARGREHRRVDVRVHTSTDLDRCRRPIITGVPCTDLERTLLDLGRYIGDARLLRAIEWCRREKRTDWSSLIETLSAHARRGRPGIRRLRRVIVANIEREEVTDSDFELLFLALLAESGLPAPILHDRIYDGERFVAEVDLAYRRLKIAIELDGAVHLEAAVRERDLPRQNDLVLLGWIVLRFSWRRFVEHPASVVAEIRTALLQRQLMLSKSSA